MKRIAAMALALTLALGFVSLPSATFTSPAFATGNGGDGGGNGGGDGGGEGGDGGLSPGAMGAIGGQGADGGVGGDYRDRMPTGQDGPTRPKSNLKDAGILKVE